MQTCVLCQKKYEYRRPHNDKSFCASCSRNRHRFALKAVSVKYKGGCCQLCGYNKCLRSLSFHHVDPTTKSFGFGGNHNISWKTIKKELDKCVCLCQNCHGEVEEEIEWSQWHNTPRSDILERVKTAHAKFEPARVQEFTRKNWREYHPATMAA